MRYIFFIENNSMKTFLSNYYQKSNRKFMFLIFSFYSYLNLIFNIEICLKKMLE